MISEKLGAIYTKIEDGFYGLMDSLDAKGIPVYKLIDFIEDKGLPFFPMFMAFIVLIIGLIIGLTLISGTINPTINLSIQDDLGNALSGVSIEIKSNGSVIFGPRILNNNSQIPLENIALGTQLEISGTKQNYDDATANVNVSSETLAASLELKKIISTITGKVKLIDKTSKTTVTDGVQVIAEWNNDTRYGLLRGEIFELTDLPRGERVNIKIISDAYEQAEFFKTFTDEKAVEELELVRRIDSFEGNSNLVINVTDKTTEELIPNARIQIYNDTTDDKISDIVTDSGTYSEALPKGTIIRIVVEADNYVKYDSSIEEKKITLANEEHVWDVELEKGGEKLRVNVKNLTDALPVSGATVELRNLLGEVLDSGTTAFAGFVEFEDLNVNETYYITAFKNGFLPARIKVTPLALESVDIELVKANQSNSSVLNVQVASSNRKPANNAVLSFFEIKNEEILPLGMPNQKTGFDGVYTTSIPQGITILAKAVKELESGEGEKTIESGINTLTIQLLKPLNVKTLELVDENGNPIKSAHVVIKTLSGTILFDANVSDKNEIIFDADSFKQLEFLVETPDGKSFSQTLDVEGKDKVQIIVSSKKLSSFNPEIKFLGIYSIDGEKIEALSIGEEAFLRFETIWPDAQDFVGAIHTRIGNDSAKYVDSQYAGITGFDVVASTFAYGTSYNAFPAPGNEAIDLQNLGEAGSYNKWLELYFDSPKGTKIVNIKVKTRENISENKLELHYRAWVESNGLVYRVPVDTELVNNYFSENKSALYAETINESLNVFTTKPLCKEGLCVSYAFVNEQNEIIKAEDFKALKDKVSALELQISSNKNDSATIKAFTQTPNSILAFTGTEIGNFGALINNDKTDASIELKDVAVSRDAFVKTRIHFKPLNTGNTFIRVQTISTANTLSEDFYFNIFETKKLVVELPSQVELKQNFEIIAKDEQGNPVTNAGISFFNANNQLISTINGNNSEGLGAGGVYAIENAFDAGTLKVKVKAELFEPFEAGIQISRTDVLIIAKEIKISIPKGQQTFSIRSTIKNSGKDAISNLSYSIEKQSLFPEALDVSLNVPAALNAGQNSPIDFSAKFVGNANENLHGEAIATITGNVAGKYPVSVKTKIIIDYNKKFEADCLQVDKTELKAYLVGELGSTQSIDITLKNNCETALALTSFVEPKDETIDVSFGSLALKAGEEKTIKINLANKIKRVNLELEEKKFDLIFSSDQLTKVVPLTVVLWNEAFALQTNDAIVMYLTQSEQGGKAIAQQPLFIRNTGFGEITNLSIAFDRPTLQGADAKIIPSTAIASLKPGESVIPPLLVEATANSAKNIIIESWVIIRGRIKGQDFELRRIKLLLYVSQGFEGLIVTIDDPLFSADESNFGIIAKRITIRNNTIEPVRIVAVEPRNLGTNILDIQPKTVIPEGRSAGFDLILAKNQDFSSQTSLRIIGVGGITNSPVNSKLVQIQVAIGKAAFESIETTTNEIQVPICGKPEEQPLTIKFPLASSGDCSKGYCDAVQLSEFFAQKLNAKAEQARSQIYQLKNETANTSCKAFSASCSFTSLGVITERFNVFFANDNLSDELMKSTIDKGAFALLKGSLVQERNIPSESQLANSFFGTKAVYIPSNFEGCGLYNVKIIGSVQNVNGRLDEGGMILAVSLEKNKTETIACANKIQNFSNFLPEDKGLSRNSSKGSWLGLIQYPNELKELGEKIATDLYAAKERASTSASNNKLIISTENIPDYLLKLEIDKSGSSSEPKTIRAIINEQYKDAEESASKDISAQVASTISNLKESNIDPEKACIAEDESFIQLKYSEKLAGGIVLDGAKTLNILPIPNSVKVTVKTKIKEKITIEKSLLLTNSALQEENVWLQKTKESERNEKLSFNEDELEIDSKTGEYFKDFFVFAMPVENQLVHAQNQKIRISAFSSENTQRKSAPFEIVAQVCATDPVTSVTKAIEKFKKNEVSPFYQTDVWKGSSRISLEELKKLLAANDVLTVDKTGKVINQKLLTKSNLTNTLLADGTKIGTCFAACGLCAAGLTALVPVLAATTKDCFIVCGISGAIDAASDLGYLKNPKPAIADAITPNNAPDFVENVAESALVPVAGGAVRGALTGAKAAAAVTSSVDASKLTGIAQSIDEFSNARNILARAEYVWLEGGQYKFYSGGRIIPTTGATNKALTKLLNDNINLLQSKGHLTTTINSAPVGRITPASVPGFATTIDDVLNNAGTNFRNEVLSNARAAKIPNAARQITALEAELLPLTSSGRSSVTTINNAKSIISGLESAATKAKPSVLARIGAGATKFAGGLVGLAVCGALGDVLGDKMKSFVVSHQSKSSDKVVTITGDEFIDNGSTYKVNVSQPENMPMSIVITKATDVDVIEEEKFIYSSCTEEVFKKELKT
ncbi:MAG: hypothetical protein Q7S21_04375 [archaeon]|nr:hypothetical protein [archaeon]